MVIFVHSSMHQYQNHDAHFWLMNVSGDRHQQLYAEFKFGNVLCYPSRHLPSVSQA